MPELEDNIEETIPALAENFEKLDSEISQIALNANNYKSFQEAVNDAIDKNTSLLLTDIFEVSENISNLHDVSLQGNGGIKRGNDIFYAIPKDTNVNKLYVGSGSNSSNDGLTKDKPISLSKARTILQRLGERASRGQWRIQFVEGTTKEDGLRFDNLPNFTKPLQIWGVLDSDGNRLAIWDGIDSSAVYAFRADSSNSTLNVEFKDLKFINWNKHPTNAGAIVCWHGVNVTTENLEIRDCTIGVWCRGGNSNHYGDVIDNCNWGYGLQYNHSGQIGSSARPATVTNCGIGVFLARQSVTHVDYSTFENNEVDLQGHQKSRIATIASKFKGWKDRSIWLQGDSLHEDSSTNRSTWDEASITDETPIYRFSNGSSVPATHIGSLPYRLAHYVPNSGYTVTGSTDMVNISAQSGFGSPLRIPKYMLYSGGEMQLKIKMRVDMSGNNSKKIMIYGPGSSNGYKLAELAIPNTENGNATGFATFEFLFRPNGGVLVEMKYESSNTNVARHQTATISASAMNIIRDKSQDLTLWRVYGQVDNQNDTLSFHSISSYMYN